MPETPEAKLEHVRGTTFRITGWVKKLGAPTNDITGDTLYFMLAEHDRETPVGAAYTLTSPNAGITLSATGKFTVKLDASLFTRSLLPDDIYWVQVDLFDASSGDTVCVGRAELEMLDNPRV
jgi:hypothetical protein